MGRRLWLAQVPKRSQASMTITRCQLDAIYFEHSSQEPLLVLEARSGGFHVLQPFLCVCCACLHPWTGPHPGGPP